jgi:hypothetical protein
MEIVSSSDDMYKLRIATNCHGQGIGWLRSVTAHMAFVHLWVMPSRDALARIIGITAKDVVTLDLLRFEKLHSLVVL